MIHRDDDMIGIMTAIMRFSGASTRLVELAAKVIAADACLSQKVSNEKSHPTSRERLFNSLDFEEGILSECKSLKERFYDKLIDTNGVCRALDGVINRIEEFTNTVFVR